LAQLKPRRMTAPVLRVATRAATLPVLGRGMRAASLSMYGIRTLRDARLGTVKPWYPPTPPLEDGEHDRP
jgi:hypothetical protein